VAERISSGRRFWLRGGGVEGVGLGQAASRTAFCLRCTPTSSSRHRRGTGADLHHRRGRFVCDPVRRGLCHLRKAPNLFQFLLVAAACCSSVCRHDQSRRGDRVPADQRHVTAFISAGGSNLLLMGILVGIFLNTQRSWTRPTLMHRERTLKEVTRPEGKADEPFSHCLRRDGRHLSPGIALAEGLTARGHETTLLISHKKVDARLMEKYPLLRFEGFPASTWRSTRWASAVSSGSNCRPSGSVPG